MSKDRRTSSFEIPCSIFVIRYTVKRIRYDGIKRVIHETLCKTLYFVVELFLVAALPR